MNQVHEIDSCWIWPWGCHANQNRSVPYQEFTRLMGAVLFHGLRSISEATINL